MWTVLQMKQAYQTEDSVPERGKGSVQFDMLASNELVVINAPHVAAHGDLPSSYVTTSPPGPGSASSSPSL
jgi:hypothetical protein